MMAAGRLAVALGMTATVAGALLYFRAHEFVGPRLRIPRTSLDFGAGSPGDVLSGALELRNVGHAPLDFHVYGSCACSSVTPQEGSVPSGGAQNVQVSVRLDRDAGKKTIVLSVRTNDPANPAADVFLLTECRLPISVAPRTIDFGYVPTGTRAERDLVVTLCDQEGGNVANIQVQGSTPDLRIALSNVRGRDATYSVSLRDRVREGPLVGSLHVLAGRNSMTVPVTADVVGEVKVAPATVLFHRADSGGLREATVIAWKPAGTPLGRLMRVESPPWIDVSDEGEFGQHRTRLVFRIRDPNVESDGEARLTFADASVAVAVRFSCVSDIGDSRID